MAEVIERQASRLAAEADLTETEGGALEGGSGRGRRSRLVSSGGLGSVMSAATAVASAVAGVATAAAAVAAVAAMAAAVAAMEQTAAARTAVATMEQAVAATTVAAIASAAVTTVAAAVAGARTTVATMTAQTGRSLAVRAQEGNADHREKDRDAESQCTIHSKILHTHGFRKGFPTQRLPSNASFSSHPAGRPPGQAKRLRQTCRPPHCFNPKAAL